jgi:hypothetical protein
MDLGTKESKEDVRKLFAKAGQSKTTASPPKPVQQQQQQQTVRTAIATPKLGSQSSPENSKAVSGASAAMAAKPACPSPISVQQQQHPPPPSMQVDGSPHPAPSIVRYSQLVSEMVDDGILINLGALLSNLVRLLETAVSRFGNSSGSGSAAASGARMLVGDAGGLASPVEIKSAADVTAMVKGILASDLCLLLLQTVVPNLDLTDYVQAGRVPPYAPAKMDPRLPVTVNEQSELQKQFDRHTGAIRANKRAQDKSKPPWGDISSVVGQHPKMAKLFCDNLVFEKCDVLSQRMGGSQSSQMGGSETTTIARLLAFLKETDSHSFHQALKGCILREIGLVQVLPKFGGGSESVFETTRMLTRLRELATVLGVITFGHYAADARSIDATHQLWDVTLDPLRVLGRLQVARADGYIALCLPWIVEYLVQAQGCLALVTSPYFQRICKELSEIVCLVQFSANFAGLDARYRFFIIEPITNLFDTLQISHPSVVGWEPAQAGTLHLEQPAPDGMCWWIREVSSVRIRWLKQHIMGKRLVSERHRADAERLPLSRSQTRITPNVVRGYRAKQHSKLVEAIIAATVDLWWTTTQKEALPEIVRENMENNADFKQLIDTHRMYTEGGDMAGYDVDPAAASKFKKAIPKITQAILQRAKPQESVYTMTRTTLTSLLSSVLLPAELEVLLYGEPNGVPNGLPNGIEKMIDDKIKSELAKHVNIQTIFSSIHAPNPETPPSPSRSLSAAMVPDDHVVGISWDKDALDVLDRCLRRCYTVCS